MTGRSVGCMLSCWVMCCGLELLSSHTTYMMMWSVQQTSAEHERYDEDMQHAAVGPSWRVHRSHAWFQSETFGKQKQPAKPSIASHQQKANHTPVPYIQSRLDIENDGLEARLQQLQQWLHRHDSLVRVPPSELG